MGQCPSCLQWNCFEAVTEESLGLQSLNSTRAEEIASRVLDIKAWSQANKTGTILSRSSTGFVLLDEALGGGLLEASLILLGGAPGVGKSTLMAQIAGLSQGVGRGILYASGEEEVAQLAERFKRLGLAPSDLFYVASTLTLEELLWKVQEIKPQMLVVDSVQTMAAEGAGYPMGSPALVRLITAQLLTLAKKKKITVFLLGHVTKEGLIAGPKHLEHMVDVVLSMEKPRMEEYRLVRVLKNRFGPAGHLVVFSMDAQGLHEVADPSVSFISAQWRERLGQAGTRVGLASSIAIDSGQPFLIQTEALIGDKKMSPGRRAALGLEPRRMDMLLAVLEKVLDVSLECTDVFLSLIGGVQAKDPGTDCAHFVALASSLLDIGVPTDGIFLGEVSLSGEVLAPRDLNLRLRQAKNLGYGKIFYPREGFWHLADFIRILRQNSQAQNLKKTQAKPSLL